MTKLELFRIETRAEGGGLAWEYIAVASLAEAAAGRPTAKCIEHLGSVGVALDAADRHLRAELGFSKNTTDRAENKLALTLKSRNLWRDIAEEGRRLVLAYCAREGGKAELEAIERWAEGADHETV